MSKNIPARGATGKSLQRLFILFLLFTFIVVAGSFILKNSITQKLDKLSTQLKKPSQQPQINNILLELDSAENNFQQTGLQEETNKLADYELKLNDIFNRVTAIFERYNADSAQYFRGGKKQIENAFQQKLKLSQHVFVLRQQFDSLLNANPMAALGKLPAIHAKKTVTKPPGPKAAGSKSGLIGRVTNTIGSKIHSLFRKTAPKKPKVDSVALLKAQGHSLVKLVKQLKTQNSSMQLSNARLIDANLVLLAQLHQLLQQLQDIDQAARERNRNQILSEYQQTAGDLDEFTGIAVTLVLIFIVLLIIYIRKAGEAEQNYLLENERAVALAAQKSEILAIMSHEIRNPLTAITGTIYMLNRTPLNADQQKKLSAVNLSSSMLIETVNNVLDLSKIEHQQSDILRQVTFYPFKAIGDAMESMRFMAEKKGIALTAEFSGDSEIAVTGDSFRLKQIMLNLLSNAIKYTEEGGVTIIAAIVTTDLKKTVLNVAIKDTGIGIPKEKQARLFTRYYQAHGANVKPGTGLGLFLCQQLIQLQGGDIRVESEVGKGCAIYFDVPYAVVE